MKYWLPLTIIILTMISCKDQPAAAPGPGDSYYFKETGYTVRDEFLRFFWIYGGVEGLGYPLTEEIIVEGWTVQYFEKGRLEYHPENEPSYRVTIGWLGDQLHRRRPPISASHIPRPDDAHHRYFPQTGHTTSGDFLDFFDAQGGSVHFGLPISEPFLLEGRLTQDFQSARFFWTPDRDPPVTLEEIGRIHLEAAGLDKALLEAAPERAGF